MDFGSSTHETETKLTIFEHLIACKVTKGQICGGSNNLCHTHKPFAKFHAFIQKCTKRLKKQK